MGNKKDIPEGWQNYSPLGKPIPGTLIVCFKVPLKESTCSAMPSTERFTPSILMSKVPNLAGVVDLTNTPRYYNKQDFIMKGILHEKIQCPGHVVPPANVVDTFKKTVENMWRVAESKGQLVGVHCTHGINRSGYLICRYLIECLGIDPDQAIQLFAESRGHGIERQNYLSDLRTLKPGHLSPSSISHKEFLQMEQQRREYWNTDAANGSEWQRGRREECSSLPLLPVASCNTSWGVQPMEVADGGTVHNHRELNCYPSHRYDGDYYDYYHCYPSSSYGLSRSGDEGYWQTSCHSNWHYPANYSDSYRRSFGECYSQTSHQSVQHYPANSSSPYHWSGDHGWNHGVYQLDQQYHPYYLSYSHHNGDERQSYHGSYFYENQPSDSYYCHRGSEDNDGYGPYRC